jgi:hypothetical protein
MQALRSRFGLLGTLLLAGLPTPAAAQPVGAEFQVNTYTTFFQDPDGERAVAADANGNFVVAWTSCCGQDGGHAGIFGQRYDSEGMALGDEFQVNTYATFTQLFPSAASDASGNFVVVWGGRGQGDLDGGIFGQRYNSGGVAQGDEFRVNSYTTHEQEDASIASNASGDFVVVWACHYGGYNYSCGIFGQRYNSEGVAQGGEFRVNSPTARYGGYPSVASDASGNFVVVWEIATGNYYSGMQSDIFGQRYDSAGSPLGTEFRVNSFTTEDQKDPSVASDAGGNFVVVWASIDQDGDAYGVFGQRYDNEGVAQGGEFRVNSFMTDSQRSPSVAADTSGNFVVVWASHDQDGDTWGVFGQRYDSEGVAQGDEFQINSYTIDEQGEPSVAATGTNEFVVVWESCCGQDGSTAGVFGQRFDFGAETITVVSPNTNVKWRIGSLHRIQWTHNLGVGETFRIELDRNDDGNYEELIAAAAPADGASKGNLAWIVTGGLSGTARVRVSWTDDLSVSDASDATFQIRPVPLDGSREE